MQDQIQNLLVSLKTKQSNFADVISFIESRYTHTPTAFKNGANHNETNQNQGSAKVFAFAQLHGLSVGDTLELFAEHYHAVAENPQGDDHQNIRQFAQHGWEGIHFEGEALQPK